SVEVNVPVEDGIFRFPAGPGARAIVPPKKPAPLLAQAPAPRSAAKAPAIDSGVISGLNARNIGSATMSGRISAVAGRNVGGKTLLFVGAASGGVWKSQDGGTTVKPVFDKQPGQAIGGVQIDPKDTAGIWGGTGEPVATGRPRRVPARSSSRPTAGGTGRRSRVSARSLGAGSRLRSRLPTRVPCTRSWSPPRPRCGALPTAATPGTSATTANGWSGAPSTSPG